jgi:hypothetical protein
MANQITGKIVVIGNTESIPSKDGSKTYNKREIVLDATKFDPYTGERGYENYPSFEFGGDKCAELDHFSAGEIVTISFDLQGTKYEKDGQTRFFTRIRGYKVERRHVQNASTQTPQSQDNDMPF